MSSDLSRLLISTWYRACPTLARWLSSAWNRTAASLARLPASMRTGLSRLFNSIWYRGNPLQWLLWPAGYLYRIASVARRTLYLRGVRRTVELPVPVIVVGNLTVGGTGKTPCIIWLARALRQRGLSIGIVTRGYGGRAKEWPQWVTSDSDPREVGDEPVLLARRTVSPVVAGPDRIAAAELLLGRQKVDVLLSDDGLQHYRMGRSFEISVVDGVRGLGNGLCLPAGPLREPPERLNDVDAIVVNGGDWRHAGVFRAELAPIRIVQVIDGTARGIEEFERREVHAVAGIGHPEKFFDMLERFDIKANPRPLADHAEITEDDLDFANCDPVMITEKDAVKCRDFAPENVWSVIVELKFEADDDERLMRLLMREIDAGGKSQ